MTTLQGYAVGALAPGRQLLFGALPTAHTQLLAHARAASVLRERGASAVGAREQHTWVASAARHSRRPPGGRALRPIHNRVFSEPLLTGTYPDLESLGLPPMPVRDGDLEEIGGSIDFYGINFYNPTTVTAAAEGSAVPFDIVPTPGAPVTGFGPEWPIVPEPCATSCSTCTCDIQIFRRSSSVRTGASFRNRARLGPRRRHGPDRVSGRHLAAVGDAMVAGVPVEEYTVWSLLDNWEWADGYTQRFGIVHVDFETGERTPKASYDWYRDVIARCARSGSDGGGEMTEVTGTRTVRAGARWMSLFTLAWLAIWTVQLTPVQLLLPLQLDTPEDDWIRGVVSSGLVLGIGGLAGNIAGPAAGALSDRAAAGAHRRRPWALGGVLFTAVCLVLTGYAEGPWAVGAGWVACRSAVAVSSAPSPLSSPDQLPSTQRGAASAAVGSSQAVGIVLGVGLVVLLGLGIRDGYLLLAGVIAVVGSAAALLLPDPPSVESDAPEDGGAPSVGVSARPGFRLDALRSPGDEHRQCTRDGAVPVLPPARARPAECRRAGQPPAAHRRVHGLCGDSRPW